MIEALAFILWAALLVGAGEVWDRKVYRHPTRQAHPMTRRERSRHERY